MSSGRFAIATHALALLAQSDESCASDALSASINTNPAFLRRILARLSQAGLIEAREGPLGRLSPGEAGEEDPAERGVRRRRAGRRHRAEPVRAEREVPDRVGDPAGVR